MDTTFTHKDRKTIQNSLNNILLDPDENDDDLIRSVSVNLQDNPPETGTEKSYHQFTIDLINFLRKNPEDKQSDVVRRALKFLLSPNLSDSFPVLPAVKAFVTGSVIHEISDPEMLLLTDEVHGLSKEEKQNAEEILLELAENSLGEDEILLEYINQFLYDLVGEESTDIVQRFHRNINKLTEVLGSAEGWNNEHKAWARGALSYIHLTEDAIPDDLGIIGLLDDMYIAGMAVRFIEPETQPWEEVISDLYSSWPFLRDLVFTFKDKEYTYSEFALINTALSCTDLTEKKGISHAALVLPSSGVTPFLIAFGAALGSAYNAAKSDYDTPFFKPGEKVRVDNDAVAIYDGVDEIVDQQYIRLKQYRKQNGHKLEDIYRIPVNQIQRLCRAPDEARAKGKIATFVENSDVPLSATEQIFHLPFPLQFNSPVGRVWLVSQVSNAKALASEIHIYGQPISSVLPIGNIKRDGDISPWSTYFGTTDSIITIIPDMDLAAEILEEQQLTADDLILIDLSKTNRNKFSSFYQIQALNARVLCVAEEKDAETITDLEKNRFDLWEWSEAEIVELVPSNKDVTTDNLHPFRRNELSTLRSFSLTPSVIVLESDDANSAKKTVDVLTAYIRKADDDFPEVLDQILGQLLDILFLLIRIPVPLENLTGGVDEVFRTLEQLSVQINSSLYLSVDEKELASNAVVSLQNFLLTLADENPKAKEISQILGFDRTSKVIITSTVLSSLSSAPSIWGEGDIVVPWQKLHDIDHDTLIIPYWPGRNKVWDIMSCPPDGKVHFVLYSFEEEWRSAFERSRNRSRAERAEHNLRSDIFTNTEKWVCPKRRQSTYVVEETPKRENSLIDERNNRRRHGLIYAARKQSNIADTEVRLVMFSGGAHAFFTKGHQAWSATHLLLDFINDPDKKEKVVPVKVDDISEHDILVFLRGTDQDAIRELADTNLPTGTRQIAGLWQQALRKYADNKGISHHDLQRQLRKAGCHRHLVTVKQWLESNTIIAPRYSHQGDLQAIADVTRDSEFNGRIEECAKAITRVWGEHLRASHTIADMVLTGIASKINEGINLNRPLDIGDGLVLAQVEYIDNEYVTVPSSIANRIRGND